MKESVRQVILDLGHMKKKGREIQISYPSTTGVDIRKRAVGVVSWVDSGQKD